MAVQMAYESFKLSEVGFNYTRLCFTDGVLVMLDAVHLQQRFVVKIQCKLCSKNLSIAQHLKKN